MPILFALALLSAPSALVQKFIQVDAPVVALRHVRLIDGTGKPGAADRTILLEHGRISALGGPGLKLPEGAKVLDLPGHTVIPGLVGMHDHLFYPGKLEMGANRREESFYNEQPFSFPRLYLAAGVTTARTTGSLEPYLDLSLKKMIDGGEIPGPRLFLTAPYLEGAKSAIPQLHALPDAAAARRMVEYWADEGFSSFKVYNFVTRAQLQAIVEAAHARKLKVTAHLCSVGYREAAQIGVDVLEHGLFADSEFAPGKQADECPKGKNGLNEVDLASGEIKSLIQLLVDKHVSIDSTLAVMESLYRAHQHEPDPRGLAVLLPETRASVLAAHALLAKRGPERAPVLKKGMAFELAFVRAGGHLMAGSDPTGIGAVLAGFGDQRNVELLVEAGFTASEAIRIATLNGAEGLGIAAETGSVEPGKRADLIVLKGDPEQRIADIENVEIVFKDGVGYDPAKLIESVKGEVGLR